MNDEKLMVYLPGLPSLGSEDIEKYIANHNARIDLVTQLSSAGMSVEDIGGTRPWLKNMMDHAMRSDAFVFPPMTTLPEGHPNFKAEAAQRWFEFFSLVTGVHIGTLEKYGRDGFAKPCVLIDPDGQWHYNMDLLRDLHKKGVFNIDIDEIVQRVPMPDIAGGYHDIFHDINKSAVRTLKETLLAKERKTRKDIKPLFPDFDFKPFRSDLQRHPFGVALFGSASSKEPMYLDKVHALLRAVANRGWRMVSGAGRDGCMGAADRGFKLGKDEFNARYPEASFKPAHVGVSTMSILRLEGPPEHLDQLIISDDIYDRMKIMIAGQRHSDPLRRTRDSTKVLFIAPGGTGTLHELATLFQLATNGSLMADRKIILLNFPSHINPAEGFWDTLIGISKRLGFNDLFTVANSVEDAIALSDQYYQLWLKGHPEYAELPHPVFNPEVTGVFSSN